VKKIIDEMKAKWKSRRTWNTMKTDEVEMKANEWQAMEEYNAKKKWENLLAAKAWIESWKKETKVMKWGWNAAKEERK